MDIILNVMGIDGKTHEIFVRKRPGVDKFLQRVAQIYELVIFTASMSKYAKPLISKLVKNLNLPGHGIYTLFRDHCLLINNGFVKPLHQLGRPMKDIIILDNSPHAYLFTPEVALPIVSWYEDPADMELQRMMPFLEFMATVEDVRPYLQMVTSYGRVDYKAMRNLIMKERVANYKEASDYLVFKDERASR